MFHRRYRFIKNNTCLGEVLVTLNHRSANQDEICYDIYNV